MTNWKKCKFVGCTNSVRKFNKNGTSNKFCGTECYHKWCTGRGVKRKQKKGKQYLDYANEWLDRERKKKNKKGLVEAQRAVRMAKYISQSATKTKGLIYEELR